MAMFDKTFPTLDCAACILTPKMVAVSQHEMYRPDDVRRGRSRSTAAPATTRSRCARRRAASTSAPASPATPARRPARSRPPASSTTVSPSARRSTCRSRRPCPTPTSSTRARAPTCRATAPSAASAPRSAPRNASTSTRRTRSSSSRSAASSSPPATTSTTPPRSSATATAVLPNVLTALEFERLTNASGPTGGKIVTKTLRHNKRTKADEWVFDTEQGTAPRNVAIIHCVGSRDAQPQRLLLARLLHVLAQVRPPRHGEAPRGQLLRVLHRHARLREGLRGVRRPHQSRRHLRGARPHGQGERARTAR